MVPRLPMRDGNNIKCVSPLSGCSVPRLPMRDGNHLSDGFPYVVFIVPRLPMRDGNGSFVTKTLIPALGS